MKKLPMLQVPLKDTKPVDWVVPLRMYLTQLYGSFNDLSEETAEFDKLRKEVMDCNEDEVGITLYFKYYCQLEMLDLRVPVHSNHGGVKVDFEWHDAFNKASKAKQNSLAYEKACVLFNLGALFSILGNSEYFSGLSDSGDGDSTGSSNFKKSLTNLQNAAGVFQFVSENFLHAPTKDLNSSAVKFLHKLMLAQAQEVFAMNLVLNDNKNYSLMAKLLQSAHNMYESCHELIRQLNKDLVWHTSYANWAHIINTKKHIFEAQACYFQSRHLETSKPAKHGESIAFLQKAIDCLNEIKSIPLGLYSSPNTSQTSINFIEALKTNTSKEMLDKYKRELELLVKDNDFIYHENVPQKFSLPIIKAMDAVKPTKFETHVNSPDSKYRLTKDLFDKIVPLGIHETHSLYSEEIAKKLREVGEVCEIADESLKSFCEAYSLPQEFMSYNYFLTSQSRVKSSEVKEAAYKNIYKSKIQSLEAKDWATIDFESLFNERQAAFQKLSQCEQFLQQDEQNYMRYKESYGASWTQQAPQFASMELKNEIIKAKQSLVEVEQSDNEMAENFGKIKQLYVAFTQHKPEEVKALVTGNNSDPSNSESLIDMISTEEDISSSDLKSSKKLLHAAQQNYSSLEYLKKELITLLKEYKEKVHNDDISNVLVTHKNATDEQLKNVIFPRELAKFEPYEDRIYKIIEKQKELMAETKSQLIKLDHSPGVKQQKEILAKVESSQSQMLKTLNKFEKTYDAIKQGYSNGIEFYKSLNSFINRLKDNCEMFFYNRAQEAAKLASSSGETSVIDKLSHLNLNPTTTTTNSNIYSSDIANQNRYSSVSTTPWSSAPLIPKKSAISDPTSSPASTYYTPPLPPLPKKESLEQKSGIPFYNTPSNYDPNMYSKFSE